MASCAQDDVTSSGVTGGVDFDTNKINFLTNTTRATTQLLTNLEDDLAGFIVYSTILDSDGDEAWSLAGDNNYVNGGTGTWSWSDSDADEVEWPTDATSYPVNFYAVYYPSTMTGVELTAASDLSETDVVPVSVGVTIAEPASQEDLLAAYASTSTKPADGKLSLAFDHVLTKVDFGVYIGLNKKIYLNGFSFVNLDEDADYDVGGSAWSNNNDSYTAAYPLTDYSAINGVEGTSTTETTATSLTILTDDSDPYSLMLIPQSATAWDISEWVSLNSYTDAEDKDIEDPTDTYVEILYRISDDTAEDGTFVDYIGFEDASDHPDFATLGSDDLAGDPLYVKVGYPVSTSWTKGKSYTYNIKLGTADASNGYLLDDVYYDENGDPTDLPIIPSKTIGDPVSDGLINFDVEVGDWDPVDAETLN